MTAFEFSVGVEGLDLLDDDIIDALFDAGCADATFTQSPAKGPVGHFHRDAPTFADAVRSAINDIESAVPDARVVSVERIPQSAAAT